MKCFLALVGISACFLTTLSAETTSGTAPARASSVPSKAKPLARTETLAQKDSSVAYYHTRYTVTGTRIPMVIRRYQGQNSSALGGGSLAAKYNSVDTRQKQPLNIPSDFYVRDPYARNGSPLDVTTYEDRVRIANARRANQQPAHPTPTYQSATPALASAGGR